MLVEHLSYINNLFYQIGDVQEKSPKYMDEASPIRNSFQYYTISSTARKFLLILLAVWYLLWQLSPLIPLEYRPAIHVDKLSEYDKYLFTTLPHQEISILHSDHLDVMMAIPYTLHVAWPLIFVAWALRKSSNLVLPFGNCFGLLSLMAVVTELLFPCAPPWYFEKYGVSPATYDLPGDPGGLARVDKFLGSNFYVDTFSKSPLVFGAFPSLHVAWPVLLAFFMWYHVCSKWTHKLGVLFYVSWVCISVVYLHHHFVVDVLGGVFYAWLSFCLLGPHCDEKPKEVATQTTKQDKEEVKHPLMGSASN
jgi:membrane-associated phospholipid phosphatase